MDRRTALKIGGATLAGGLAMHSMARAGSSTPGPALSDPTETIALWPGVPPGGDAIYAGLRAKGEGVLDADPADRAIANIADPRLLVFPAAKSDGAAMLILCGGGYQRENIGREGFAVAQRLAAAGISASVLVYRLPGEGWANRKDVALEDAMQAMRVLRTNASRLGIDLARTGVLGFSAGGHLAGLLATRGGEQRPAFVALGYPVVTMTKPFAHEASREHLFGQDAGPAERAAYSIDRLVRSDTPPIFLFAAEDDPDVPVENSLMLNASLRTNRVASELHLFERGGHGFGLGDPLLTASAWPDLFLRWGRTQGFLRA